MAPNYIFASFDIVCPGHVQEVTTMKEGNLLLFNNASDNYFPYL
jgi:hypothetical protein